MRGDAPTATEPAAGSAVPLVVAEGIRLSRDGQAVLSDVSVAVAPGQVVSVIGPNGAGKTTLVRILLGLVRPDAGTVQRRTGLTVGYMPQRVEIDRTLPLTVRRFLSLGGPVPPGRRRAVSAEVGVDRLLDRPVQAVSGGELQRVLLARALLREPDLLVLDEPAQGVDIVGQAELYELIRTIRDRRGCGVLLVSHDLHLVMAATDHVLCLNHHVCCTGHPERVSRDPAYLTLFGRRATVELAPYTHHHDHAHDVHGNVVPMAAGDHAGHRHG